MTNQDINIEIGATSNLYKLPMLDANGDPLDISTWVAESEVRDSRGCLILTLAPSIQSTEVHILLSDELTSTVQFAGVFKWDLKMTSPSGDVFYTHGGKFIVTQPTTE